MTRSLFQSPELQIAPGQSVVLYPFWGYLRISIAEYAVLWTLAINRQICVRFKCTEHSRYPGRGGVRFRPIRGSDEAKNTGNCRPMV